MKGWAIHDLLAYGLLSNQVIHGYEGCLMWAKHNYSSFKKTWKNYLCP
jgi:hypothetical protein